METPEGQVPQPRRSRPPLSRRPATPTTPTELPFQAPDDELPRVPGLADLLADIDALRLTLQTDLSLAAAALDAGADELAGELVDGDLAELRAFAQRATDRLADLEDDTDSELEPAATPIRRRRILSAAPLMAAAAALLGFVAFVPDRAPASPETTMSSAVMTSFELSRLAEQGAPDEELRSVAEELNDELAALIAQAAEDPAAAQQALLLLETTTQVLSSQGDSGVLRSVIAETRALRQRLRNALPAVSSPKRPQSRPVVRAVVPVLPRVQEEPEKERTESSAPKSSSKSSPSPSSSPKPSPSSSPSPSPSPSPSGSESPSSGEAPPGPLPEGEDDKDGVPGNLPGV